LKVSVQTRDGLSLEEIRAFLKGNQGVRFEGQQREEIYAWVDQALRQQDYRGLGRTGRGLVRQYLGKMTGLSRAQVTRLITPYLRGEEVQSKAYRRRRFPSVYTPADAELLASVDEAHETLSGPATQKVLQREFHDFGDRRYQRLARISVAQLYRLRQSRRYRQRRVRYAKTRPVQVAIGERRRPDPQGRPGYLRVDTVHQGDQDGVKGMYHINAVDEVTQWEIVGAAEQISEAWLLPVLEAMLEQFPFPIRGFHSDNGSEYINHTVARLLNKLLAEQTKSRPRHSNDNGLVEAKNGAVIRKHMGYGHIAAEHAEAFQNFYRDHFNPYLNFHRPCGHAEIRVDHKGKQKRVYRWYATPWEMLHQLPGVAGYLKPNWTIDDLNRQAQAHSDTQAAAAMQKAKGELFARIYRRRTA
jgi:transposase InsO family protein